MSRSASHSAKSSSSRLNSMKKPISCCGLRTPAFASFATPFSPHPGTTPGTSSLSESGSRRNLRWTSVLSCMSLMDLRDTC